MDIRGKANVRDIEAYGTLFAATAAIQLISGIGLAYSQGTYALLYYIGLAVHKQKISYWAKDDGGKIYAEGRFRPRPWMKH